MSGATHSVNTSRYKTDNPLLFGLALAAGIGVVLMIIALAVGVVQGDAANNSAIGLTFIIGLAALITGAAAWTFVVQPYKHFDDINQPLEDDHGHGHAHDAAHDEPHDADHPIAPAQLPAPH